MKVIIDEAVFNKAIAEEKLELAEWLLENNCPCDDIAYVQNFNIQVLEWLQQKHIPMSKECLGYVIDKTDDLLTINWFIKNGATINQDSLQSCIRNNRNEIFWSLLKKTKISLNKDYFRTAIMSENIEVLNYLFQNEIKCDEEIVELAMKNKKKNSLKWLIKNDLF